MSRKRSHRIPDLAEAIYYLQNIIGLMQNKSENARAFYHRQASVTRSFYAYIWCLPAQAFMWSLIWRSYTRNNSLFKDSPPFIEDQLFFLIKIAFFDLVNWLLLAVIIFVMMSILSQKQRIIPLIIASNWFSLFVTYLFFTPSTISYLLPVLGDFIKMSEFVIYFMTIGLYFRLMRHLLAEQKMIAFALTLANVVSSLFISKIAFGLLLT